jgi:tetratricopeptide (TPR) repeat protein
MTIRGQQTTGGAGQTKARDLSLERGSVTAPTPRSAPRGFALIVGIGKYKNLTQSESLDFPESDAEAIYRTLISRDAGAFPAENVHKLIGPQATLANIRKELEEWLPSVAQPADRVVVYFSGHGLVDPSGRGYLAAYDVSLDAVSQTAYPMTRLGEALGQKVKARQKVLLVDACHSGKITPDSSDENVAARLSSLPQNFLTFTATRQRERSYEDRKLSTGFGLFTYFVVQGLEGNADVQPCDGVVTADELVQYVTENVRKYARDRNVEQNPTTHGDFDNNLVLAVPTAKRECADPGAASAASMSGALVVQTNMDDVDVYIDDKLIGRISKGKPLPVPGMSGGPHVVKGVRAGYEPDTKEVTVIPGQEVSVTLRIQYRREVKKAALDLVERGERLLHNKESILASFNPLGAFRARSQSRKDLERARDLFRQALAEDSHYAKAAYDLATACQLLSEEPGMMKAFARAVEIDPGYLDARIQYAGALIEAGDPDAAIRQLTETLRLEPGNDEAYSHMARAFLDKEAYEECIRSSDRALAIRQNNDQARLWRADALRRLAAAQEEKALRSETYARAIEDYRTFLRLTNFSTPAYERMAVFFFAVGSTKHADRRAVYAYQRSLALLGLCEAEDKLSHWQRATDYCTQSLKYDPSDEMAYFLRGNAYRDLFREYQRWDDLMAARENYTKVLALNRDFEFSRNVRDYLDQIDAVSQAMRRQGLAK